MLSSANNLISEERDSVMSLMYIGNSKGPSTVPWGTPESTDAGSDIVPFTATDWVLLYRNAFIHFRVVVSML